MLARRRLLRAGAAAVSAPRASYLAVVDILPSPFPRHVEPPRFFSLQKKDDDNDDAHGSWTTLALYSPVAWQEAVKPALLAFLKIEQHLMVPVVFTVPYGDAAWPRAAWGYPLGKHAALLRKQWRAGGHKIDPTQLKELNEMQFAWDRTQYKWDQFVLPALGRFFELNDHTDVPSTFVIPKGDPQWPERLWGRFRGYTVHNIRSRDDFSQQTEVNSKELERLRFCHDSTIYDRDWREKVIPGLKAFWQQFGHCRIPPKFVVPSNEAWPTQAWGFKLGVVVRTIRNADAYSVQVSRDRLELESIGFVWDASESKWSDRILPALEVFRQLNGHCCVPKAFEVPLDENWPEQSRGLKLGNTVDGIRNSGYYAAQVARDKSRLLALGFVWDVSESEWSERIFPALKIFCQEYRHCRVQYDFVVPSNDIWPKQAWDLKLGSVVRNIRSKDAYSAQVSRDKTQLEALGFVWDASEWEWSERIFPALKTFRQLNGHCRVPKAFVVPLDENWPEQSRGLRLGDRVDGIRNSGYYAAQVARDKSRLVELGFVWKFYEAEWMKRILPAWEVFYKVHGHCRVPQVFVVPSEAPWPVEAHDMKLGSSVTNIREKGGYFDYTVRSMDSLEAIECDLTIPASKWTERVEPLLATFELLVGHRNVPRDFVIPSESPWKERDWGIQLGKLKRKTPSQEA